MVHPFVTAAAKTVTLVLGAVITLLALRAYRRTGARELRALAIGFGIVTVGAGIAGAANLGFGVSFRTSALVESLVTAVGFAVITYSLYAE